MWKFYGPSVRHRNLLSHNTQLEEPKKPSHKGQSNVEAVALTAQATGIIWINKKAASTAENNLLMLMFLDT